MAHDGMVKAMEALEARRVDEGDSEKDPWAIFSTDIINAFNELRRNPVMETLLTTEESSGLARLFRWSYGAKAALFHGDGSLACYSETGMRQGDPLGPLFFSMGYWRSVLKKCQERFPWVTFLAYIDDTYFVCRRSEGKKILEFMKKEMLEVGLRLSLGEAGKVKCLDPSPEAIAGRTEFGYEVVKDGITVLGGPVSFGVETACGAADYRSNFLRKALASCTNVLEILPELPDPQAAYWILAQCVNARVSYLCRISAPWHIAEFLTDFDEKVDDCLAKILAVQGQLPRAARIIRGLPGKLGGGCIRRARDTAACAFSASFLHAMTQVRVQCRSCGIWRGRRATRSSLIAVF